MQVVPLWQSGDEPQTDASSVTEAVLHSALCGVPTLFHYQKPGVVTRLSPLNAGDPHLLTIVPTKKDLHTAIVAPNDLI